jgi:hypothetical protein
VAFECGAAAEQISIVSDHKIDNLAKELPTVTEIHRGLPLALLGRWPCWPLLFVME